MSFNKLVNLSPITEQPYKSATLEELISKFIPEEQQGNIYLPPEKKSNRSWWGGSSNSKMTETITIERPQDSWFIDEILGDDTLPLTKYYNEVLVPKNKNNINIKLKFSFGSDESITFMTIGRPLILLGLNTISDILFLGGIMAKLYNYNEDHIFIYSPQRYRSTLSNWIKIRLENPNCLDKGKFEVKDYICNNKYSQFMHINIFNNGYYSFPSGNRILKSGSMKLYKDFLDIKMFLSIKKVLEQRKYLNFEEEEKMIYTLLGKEYISSLSFDSSDKIKTFMRQYFTYV